jgi:agmatine deiminase
MTRIGLIQTAAENNVERNVVKAIHEVKEAAGKGAQIVCLQELFATTYFPHDEMQRVNHLAVTIPGALTGTFCALAKQYCIVIVLPLFEKGIDGQFYNSAVVIDADGTLLETYRKTHIPHDPFFYEKNYFRDGNKAYKVYRTKYASISVLICYDQWFPEAARICALEGAEILLYPTAIGYLKEGSMNEGDWQNAWETMQRSHAIANGVHVAAVNRVGREGNIEFFGSSFVCDAFGNVVHRASKHSEETVIATIDTSRNKEIQDSWGFLKNRRPDTYDRLTIR